MSADDWDRDIENDPKNKRKGKENRRADKRAHHNAEEKGRRDHIRASYHSLRDSLPYFKGGKVKASQAQILKQAADYIKSKGREIPALQQDIDNLKEQNKALDDQIRGLLEMAKTTGNFAAAAAVIEQYDNVDSKVAPGSYEPETESEDSSKNNADSIGSYDPETESEDSSKNNANSRVALGSYDPETESEDSSDKTNDSKDSPKKKAKNKF